MIRVFDMLTFTVGILQIIYTLRKFSQDLLVHLKITKKLIRQSIYVKKDLFLKSVVQRGDS